MTAKRKGIILAAVVAIVAAAALYLLAYTGSTTIPGFHFTGKDGVVAVRADRLMIEGGFFKHPVLENAYIDAHAGPKKGGDDRRSGPQRRLLPKAVSHRFRERVPSSRPGRRR